eukprot:TRINITY_DN4118_c0_g1_i1.p2 TRINITY_DN4118_c0_g1~~TRINITY_DN4118_c0_g1_i1.p2  ORF type:complete len:712 (+),score=265.30 TRINITY_DN4118_c0_g1_i1:153-2288(+)
MAGERGRGRPSRPDDSEEELDCLPDLAGKYAHVGKPLGAWRPQAKKEFAGGLEGYQQAVAEQAMTPEQREKSELLSVLGDAGAAHVGGGAVRAGCAGVTNDGCSRVLRQTLQSSARLREKKDLFGALRWMVSGLGLCKNMKRVRHDVERDGERSPTAAPVSSPSREEEAAMVDQVTRAYNELRHRIATQLKNGAAPPSKADIDAHHAAGCTAREKNDLNTALREFKEVLKLRVSAVGENHPETALARSHVATVIRDMGNLKGAMAELKKALHIQELSLGEGHPHVAITRNNIGAVLKHQGKSEDALNEHRKALVILVTYYGEKGMRNKYMAEVYEHIGHALRIQGDIFGALVGYEVALSIRKKILPGEKHPKTLRIIQKIESLEACWTGPARSMMRAMRQRGGGAEWECPSCSWKTTLDVCSCCSYRRPFSKDGIPQFFKGMSFAFTGMIPKSVHASAWREWQLAEQHGATCTEDVEEGVTHLIYREGYERSGKVQHAQQLHVKVLLADWFYQSINIGVALEEGPFLAEATGQKGSLHTKKLAHVRPGGGAERAQSCPPWRCILAPPRHRSCAFTENLPGPTTLMESSASCSVKAFEARGLPVPASPTARRPGRARLSAEAAAACLPSPTARAEIGGKKFSAFQQVSRPHSCSPPPVEAAAGLENGGPAGAAAGAGSNASLPTADAAAGEATEAEAELLDHSPTSSVGIAE